MINKDIKVTQLQIFLAFLRVGLFGFGGGPASIPLVYKEVVEKYKWMDGDNFSDTLAIANTLPGPIATKMSGYIGYRIKGVIGMLNALFALVLPSVILMILFLTILFSYKDESWVIGMTRGVIPVVGVMMGILTWQFLVKSKKGLGIVSSIVLTVLSFTLLYLIDVWFGIDVHPVYIIIVMLLAAIFMPNKEGCKND